MPMPRLLPRALAVVALAVVLVGIVRAAWLCDDVYITLRTIDNWVHGAGLRWNVAERVQSYTHPLWMLLLSSVYLFTREPYYTTLAVSLLTTAVALALLAFGVAKSPLRGALAVLVLGSSHAFVAYSTSGLENPLTNLLLVVFAMLLASPERSPRRLARLTFVGALLMLNRLDDLLLVAPVLLFELVELRSRAALRAVVVGAAPLLVWEAFSFFYYGSLVPNTAYAKLHHRVPRAEVLAQGWRWVQFTLHRDWPTCATVLVATVAAAIGRDRRQLACALGCVLYVGYAVWIGGDFMGGRFWVAPLVLAVTILAQHEARWATWTLPLLALTSVWLPLKPVPFGGDPRVSLGGAPGVWDERASYFRELGLLNVGLHARGPLHGWARWGAAEGAKGPHVVGFHAVGMFSYYGGPQLHVVDLIGLCDPLLARVYPVRSAQLAVGHLHREPPTGYIATLSGGNNVIADPSLHRFYDVLADVTRGPLWSWTRVVHAAGLVTGRYQPLLDRYEQR